MPRQKVMIRKAMPFDVGKIMRLLEDAYDTMQTPFPEINPVRLMLWIARALADAEVAGGFVNVATTDNGNRIVGSLGFSVAQVPWSDTFALSNEWFYVFPRYRRYGVADAMLTHVERWADEKGVPFMMGIMDTQDRELKELFLKRRKGYILIGSNFLRWPQDG